MLELCYHTLVKLYQEKHTLNNWSTSSMSPGMSERALNICAEFSNCFKSVSERIFNNNKHV